MSQIAVRQYNGRLRLLEQIPPDAPEINYGDFVVYETPEGLWCDKAFLLPGRLVLDRREMETVRYVRLASQNDYRQVEEKNDRERKAFLMCKEKIAKLGLPMKLVTAVYTFDYRRLTFFFSANGRIDFRELLKSLNKAFRRTRILLRQIGIRNETGLLGGVGPCGRELCCSSFLNSFESITLQMAVDQDLPPNPARLSGNCGRLKCCLRYEQDYYLFMKERMPEIGERIQLGEKTGKIIRHHVLTNAVDVIYNGKRLTWDLDEINEAKAAN